MPSAVVKVSVPQPPASGVRLRVVQDSTVQGSDVRPRTRGECVDGPRPCPWVDCRHHLASDRVQAAYDAARFAADRADTKTGNGPRQAALEALASVGAVLEQTRREAAGMVETCALDIADLGPHTHEAVGEVLGVTREAVRQIEGRAGARIILRTPYLRAAIDTTPERSAI